MDKNTINPLEKHLEKGISQIGAKVADAVEISEKIKELSGKSAALLIDAQKKLEELYISIGEASGLK